MRLLFNSIVNLERFLSEDSNLNKFHSFRVEENTAFNLHAGVLNL